MLIRHGETTIVDGPSGTDIGDLPALSIGEAPESICGAAAHRENGGGSAILLGGLGPFLSATLFIGRGATFGISLHKKSICTGSGFHSESRKAATGR